MLFYKISFLPVLFPDCHILGTTFFLMKSKILLCFFDYGGAASTYPRYDPILSQIASREGPGGDERKSE